ncbi:MAG: UTP--glucose-1-phosphate uridylyltransferase [bacterium]|nr:UTP--glucose-1-phosphate uridylyltransferase [bacterium]
MKDSPSPKPSPQRGKGEVVRKAIIPAAGLGTRFLPITKSVPKELLPIGNKPCIQYVIEEAVASGIEEIIVIFSANKKSLIDYLTPNPLLEKILIEQGKEESLEKVRAITRLARFTFVEQKNPKGLGHAVLCAKEAVGKESFLILLPDMITKSSPSYSRQLIQAHEETEKSVLILLNIPKEEVVRYGIADVEKVKEGLFKLNRVVEKPKMEEAPSTLCIAGQYLFTADLFSHLEQVRPGRLGEIQLTDAIQRTIEKNGVYGTEYVRGDMYDTGTPEGLIQVCKDFF